MSEGDYEFDEIPVEDLEGLEESALQLASQKAHAPPLLPNAPITRSTHAVRHALAPPASGPRAAPSAAAILKQPPPRPLNTTPGTSGTGFGWEQGGKRNLDVEGNQTRFVDQVKKREMYWTGNASREYEYGPAYVPDVEEEVPEVVINEQGGYGYSQAQVGQMSAVSDAGKAARRAALLGGGKSAPPPQPEAGPSRPFAQRNFTKSVSAGNLPSYTRSPLTTSLAPRLSPIPAEDKSSLSSSQPSSQGAKARREAVAMEEAKKRETAPSADMGRSKPAQAPIRAQTQAQTGLATSSKPGVVDTGQANQLQQEVWRAKGEIANVRRQQTETNAKHQAERDSLKLQIAELEARITKKDLETKKALESMKSQAVFAQHTATNSIKRRDSYPSKIVNGTGYGTPAGGQTPLRGSPRGKQKEREEAARSAKGSERQGPAPRMGKLVSAFDTPSVIVKRQRTQAPSPMTSPSKGQAQNGHMGDISMDDGVFGPGPEAMEPPAELEEVPKPEPDIKAELLFHLFDCRSRSVLSPSDLTLPRQPIIAQLLDYRPPPARDDGEYGTLCAKLLRGCHEPDATAADVQVVIASCIGEMMTYAADLSGEEDIAFEQIEALVHFLRILALTCWRFDSFADVLLDQNPVLPSRLQNLANAIYSSPSVLDRLQERIFGKPPPPPAPPDSPSYLDPYDRRSPEKETVLPPPREWTREEKMKRDWPRAVAVELVSLAGALSWFSANTWNGPQLVDLIMGLTQPHMGIEVVRSGLELAWMASCQWTNFQAVIASSPMYPSAKHTEQPVLDRLARLLLHPHTGASEVEVHEMSMTVVRTLSLLAVATHEAVLLVAERSAVIPALIHVLDQTSTQVYGVSSDAFAYQLAQTLLPPTLSLFYFLLFPISFPPPTMYPSASSSSLPPLSQTRVNPGEPPQGISLPDKLQALSGFTEWNGVQHVFKTALGRLNYADLDLEPDPFSLSPSGEAESDMPEGAAGWKRWDEGEFRSVQYMAADVLEEMLQAPEEEGPICEMYAETGQEEHDEFEELGADPGMEVDVPEL